MKRGERERERERVRERKKKSERGLCFAEIFNKTKQNGYIYSTRILLSHERLKDNFLRNSDRARRTVHRFGDKHCLHILQAAGTFGDLSLLDSWQSKHCTSAQ